jgi:hypothetical protein
MYAPWSLREQQNCLVARFIDITNEAGAKEKFPN